MFLNIEVHGTRRTADNRIHHGEEFNVVETVQHLTMRLHGVPDREEPEEIRLSGAEAVVRSA
jgi:hypothetical protein